MKKMPDNLTHTTIKCIDCGAERRIRIRDREQTIRCVECQMEHRRQARRELHERQKNNQ